MTNFFETAETFAAVGMKGGSRALLYVVDEGAPGSSGSIPIRSSPALSLRTRSHLVQRTFS